MFVQIVQWVWKADGGNLHSKTLLLQVTYCVLNEAVASLAGKFLLRCWLFSLFSDAELSVRASSVPQLFCQIKWTHPVFIWCFRYLAWMRATVLLQNVWY